MKILAPHPNTPVPTIRKALVVLIPVHILPVWERMVAGETIGHLNYHQLPPVKKILLWFSHIRYERSNPRDPEYMLNLLSSFLENHFTGVRMDILIGGDFPKPLGDHSLEMFECVWKVHDIQQYLKSSEVWMQLEKNHYDSIFMLYTDPLGIGYGRIERKIGRFVSSLFLVLNGRGRLFYWDNHARANLNLRRWVEMSCLPEIFLSIFAILISIPLVLLDTLVVLFSIRAVSQHNER